MTTRQAVTWGWTLGFAVALPAAATITFETVPGGVPVDGLEIGNDYVLSDSIIFRLEDGSKPRLAQVGGPRTAFGGPPNNAGDDNALSGQGVGQFFLTDDGVYGTNANPSPLIIGYGRPTPATSGSLLDIDDGETVTIEARGLTENILDTIVINAGDPGTGDGVATFWDFTIEEEEIFSVRISGTSPTNQYSLALDNLNTKTAGIPGNYNGGIGLVEQGDLDLVLANWGRNTETQGIPFGWVSDLPTGVIDQNELDSVLRNWGNTEAPSFGTAAVPEPAALSVLALGLAWRRR